MSQRADQINREDLISALTACVPTGAKDINLNLIDNGALVSLTITAVGMQLSAQVSVMAGSSKDGSANDHLGVSVELQRLLATLKTLAGVTVTLKTDKNRLVVGCGKSTSRLPAAPMLVTPIPEYSRDWFDLGAWSNQLRHASASTIIPYDVQGSRGILFLEVNRGTYISQINGVVINGSLVGERVAPGMLIPNKLVSVIKQSWEAAKISINDRTVAISSGAYLFVALREERKIPDYARLINPAIESTAEPRPVNRRALISALRAASPFREHVANDNVGTSFCNLESWNGSLRVSATGTDGDTGEVETEIDVDWVDSSFRFTVNSKYLLDFLGSVDCEAVKLQLHSPRLVVVTAEDKISIIATRNK